MDVDASESVPDESKAEKTESPKETKTEPQAKQEPPVDVKPEPTADRPKKRQVVLKAQLLDEEKPTPVNPDTEDMTRQAVRKVIAKRKGVQYRPPVQQLQQESATVAQAEQE